MSYDLTPERLEEIGRMVIDSVDPDDPELREACNALCRMARLALELERAIRETHTNYCTEAWTGRGLHAPECLLYELGGADA